MFLGLAGALRPALAAEEDADLAFLVFDRYYDVEEVEAVLRRIHAAHPDRTRLESMGKSREGRDLWVLAVFDPSTGDPADKPALYVDGNTHGNEVQCTEVCLYLAKHLLRAQRPRVRDLLRRVTFHIAPSVNPDSRHRFFHTPQTPHAPRGVLRPVDDDGDGLFDEDGPNDLDGDGHIVSMRIRDPHGTHVVDERDPRLMRAVRPGERGTHRLLGTEGFDDDGDGEINEDGPGGVDPNRNFPGHWRPDCEQSGAGPYPLSEPETRATARWILRLRHLSGVQSFHNAGRMILRPPAAFTDIEAGMPEADVALYREMQRRGLYVLPTYRAMQIREDLYRVYGGFVDWTWFDLGLWSFTNELWGRLDVEGPGGDPRLEALRWNDAALGGEGFVPWHETTHAALGKVEVGGWKRFTVRSDPVEFLPDTCLRNTLFVLQHAEALPDLDLSVLPGPAEGTIDVTLENRALLPTIGALAQKLGTLPADTVAVEGGRLLAAAWSRLPGDAQLDEVLALRGQEALLPQGVAGLGRIRIRLYVEGTPTHIVFRSRTGGTHRTAWP